MPKMICLLCPAVPCCISGVVDGVVSDVHMGVAHFAASQSGISLRQDCTLHHFTTAVA